MSPRVSIWLGLLDEALQKQENPQFQASEFDWLGSATLSDLLELLEEILARDGLFEERWGEHFRAFFDRLARRPAMAINEEQADRLASLASELLSKFAADSPARYRLLGWLATFDAGELLEIVAEDFVENPPASDREASIALSSLFRSRRQYPVEALFPRLLSALGAPAAAALVLDLGNFLMRHRRVERHPAETLGKSLQELLGQVVSQLEIFEESPPITADMPNAQQAARERLEQINEGVTLAISLCDTLAWCGDKSALPKLHRAVELAHRRLRAEAASAIARLEDQQGIEILAKLVAEPVVRLRALAYLRELGQEEAAPAEFRTREALAQAEMVVHLAEPTQFGLPPAECELLDQRTQYWPGFDNPIECFLFHYRYQAGESTYANVGIVGPLTRSVVADLSDLPAGDIYAFYAGWHATHDDIREVSAVEARRAFPAEIALLERKAAEAGLEQLEVHKMGLFFGEKVLAATARRGGAVGAAVVDVSGVSFYPFGGKRAPIGPEEAYDIYKGKRLLASFNR